MDFSITEYKMFTDNGGSIHVLLAQWTLYFKVISFFGENLLAPEEFQISFGRVN